MLPCHRRGLCRCRGLLVAPPATALAKRIERTQEHSRSPAEFVVPLTKRLRARLIGREGAPRREGGLVDLVGERRPSERLLALVVGAEGGGEWHPQAVPHGCGRAV